MILYEYEGKEMLKQAGVKVPNAHLIDSLATPAGMTYPVVVKAQVLSGKRAENGGIAFANDASELSHSIDSMLDSQVNGERVGKILIEEKIDFEKAYYLSLSYDTDFRSPVLTFSEFGGTGVEERAVKVYPINSASHDVILNGSEESLTNVSKTETSSEILRHSPQDDMGGMPPDLLKSLIEHFFSSDCLLLEINPLVHTKQGEWIALDAKVKIDDDAKNRHPEWKYPPRLIPGHEPTQREVEAKKIDEGDYRGTAGSTYLDLDGDIAVLSSGGGISLTAMDALIVEGGKASNFTEYSGNPPKEKVVKLTKIVLSKPEIHGLWVIGTVAANFTDIYETLTGLIEGLREAQKELKTVFKFPIVIRRGGPREKEAYLMLKEVKDFNLTLQGEETSISQSAKIMVDLAKEYANVTK